MTKAKPLPPLEVVRKLLDYDKTTGAFIRRVNAGMRKVGSEAGWLSSDGYRYISVQGREYAAHRLAWLVVQKADPAEFDIDHIDGNKQNNAFSNLRLATRRENTRNSRTRQNNACGFKGVHFRKDINKWRATIHLNGQQISLGCFDTPELAHMAYCKAAAELHGEFARAA